MAAKTSGVSGAKRAPVRRLTALPGKPRRASSMAARWSRPTSALGVLRVLPLLPTTRMDSSHKERRSPSPQRSSRSAKMLRLRGSLALPPGKAARQVLGKIHSWVHASLRCAVSAGLPGFSQASSQLCTAIAQRRNSRAASRSKPFARVSRVMMGAAQISSRHGRVSRTSATSASEPPTVSVGGGCSLKEVGPQVSGRRHGPVHQPNSPNPHA